MLNRYVVPIALILVVLVPGSIPALYVAPHPSPDPFDDTPGVLASHLATLAASWRPSGANPGSHSCAITENGGVRCWGDNSYGQLGDDTTIDRPSPVQVRGLTEGVVGLAAGSAHTCAAMNAAHGGGVKCWGGNGSGALGDGTTTGRLAPVDVQGLTGEMLSLTAGDYDTCAVTVSGSTFCWGSNSYGQLGDGTTATRLTPTPVVELTSGTVAVAAGMAHTCALTEIGGVKCWGTGENGRLGTGDTASSPTPVDVSGMRTGVTSLSAGNSHTCAVSASGEGTSVVKCWGINFGGQLGEAPNAWYVTPVDVPGLPEDVVRVAAGYRHTCALTAGGNVLCWGDNSFGQLGDGTMQWNPQRSPVTGIQQGAVEVAAGGWHSCARFPGGGIRCWGSNSDGQVGTGSFTSHTAPTLVVPLGDAAGFLDAGTTSTCVVTASGGAPGAKCWGQLDWAAPAYWRPAAISGLARSTRSISAGNFHFCAVTTDGGVKCWGNNEFGQLGDGTRQNRDTPVDVVGLSSGVLAVAVGSVHMCAVMEPARGGQVKCWGQNNEFQLGDGTRTDQSTPVDVKGLEGEIVAIAVGGLHTCALSKGGGVKCWGAGYRGQLGNGSFEYQSTAVNVESLTSGVVAVVAGIDHTCALLDAANGGGVTCWGANQYGQLGDGATGDRSLPAEVHGLRPGTVTFGAGWYHTCTVTAEGGMQCWGANGYGQIGDGTKTERLQPVDVRVPNGGVAMVSGGEQHTCALTDAAHGNLVWCWGNNAVGQLGFDPGWEPANVVGFWQQHDIPLMVR